MSSAGRLNSSQTQIPRLSDLISLSVKSYGDWMPVSETEQQGLITMAMKLIQVSAGMLRANWILLPPRPPRITVGQLNTQGTQWLELYNTTNQNLEIAYKKTDPGYKLYLLFTPFVSYPDRRVATYEGQSYTVLDAISNLVFGLWRLPGKSGRRPTTAFVSAYRKIDYDVVEDQRLSRTSQLAGIPFGSSRESWAATDDSGRRNTILRILAPTFGARFSLTELPHVSTPGTRHVTGAYLGTFKSTSVASNSIVINEVRNDTSSANIDWIELKNVGSRTVDLEKWELSIVTDFEKDNDLVDLPTYPLGRNEILLILNKDPHDTELAGGINILEFHRQSAGASHKYFIDKTLDLPEDKTFLLLFRNPDDQNGKPEAIVDYAGNGFFKDPNVTTDTYFWPLLALPVPNVQDVADFGENTFASPDQAYARIRYQQNDGHHKDAWKIVEAQGGIGYAPGADLNTSPGTPGYENNALKTQVEGTLSANEDVFYNDGEISFSEIMYHPGTKGNSVQWIELYNASKTQAINLNGWYLDIRNLEHAYGPYIDRTFELKDAIIRPNQTLLFVSKQGVTNLPSNTVYDLSRNHRSVLARNARLLNPNGFFLKLTDPGHPERNDDDTVVDEVGNLQIDPTGRSKAWDLPSLSPEHRRSIVRLYGPRFNPESRSNTGTTNPPNRGMAAESWRLFPREVTRSVSFYGIRSDLANPGFRLGGPLPVVLSHFRPVRQETGNVRVTWRTASEVNNAGFNILWSRHRGGEFKVINRKGIIPGQGTRAEMSSYTYIDTTAKPHTTYYYRIEDVSFAGVRQTLATTWLKGDISSVGKLTTLWSRFKGAVAPH